MDTRIFSFPDHIRAIAEGVLPPPIHVFLDATRHCTQSCWYCYERIGTTLGIRRRESARRHAPAGDLLGWIRSLAREGVHAVDVCGGEPLLHPSAADILRAIVDAGLGFGLVTNGTVWNDRLLRILGDHAVWVRYSVDTMDEDLYRRTRRPRDPAHDLRAVVAHIETLLEHRRATGRRDLRVGANSVVDGRHTPHVLETARRCREMGLDYLRFALVSAGQRVQRQLYPNATLRELLQAIDSAKALEDDTFEVVAPEPLEQRGPDTASLGFRTCYWSLLTLTVDVDGNAYTCPEMKYDPRFRVGSLAEQSAADVLRSPRRWEAAWRLKDCVSCCHLGFNRMLHGHLTTSPGQRPFI